MHTLNDMQEAFCQAYVTNGGHAANAAEAAGYAHPYQQGSRLLTNPKVSARLKELIGLNMTSRLGELVQEAFGVALDHEAPTRDRLTAIFGLMDRGGLTVPKQAPSVAVQISVSDRGNDRREVSAVIGDIEALRTARLGTAGSC